MGKDADDKAQPEGKSAGQQAFCFCLGELVDCIPGVVLDCNNKRTTKCPLLEEKKHTEKKKNSKKQDSEKKDNRAFCFCLGSQVDCLPGVVLDCNNKRTTKCPLVMDVLSASAENQSKVEDFKKNYKNKNKKQKGDSNKKTEGKEEKKDNRAFCFCLGSQVDCLPGVVLDCNNKRTTKCPLVMDVLSASAENQSKVEDFKKNYKNKNKKQKSDSNKKTEGKEEKKDNRAFCFCLGSQVDCLPGVVLDCNNKRTTKCPLVMDVVSVKTEMDNQVDDLKKKYLNNEHNQPESNHSSEQKKTEQKKDNRAFCFCLGSQVDCLPGVVLDCNNKRTTKCPLVMDVLSVNKEAEQQIENLRGKYKKKG